MRRRVLLFLGGVFLLGLLSALWALRSYTVEFVHPVVVNAVIQKAPEDYPSGEIRNRFATALRQANDEGEREEYLQHLLALAQRLEKRQRLETREVDQILRDLSKP